MKFSQLQFLYNLLKNGDLTADFGDKDKVETDRKSKHQYSENTPFRQNGALKMRHKNFGFTMIEIIVFIVILSIAALLTVPLFSSGAQLQLRAAADMIAADLDYAKNLAITNQQSYSVIFDTANDSYQIEDPCGIIDHPVNKGHDYLISFESDSRFSQVDLVTADFEGDDFVTFTLLGGPVNLSANEGTIEIQGGGTTITINVQPVTGLVTITD